MTDVSKIEKRVLEILKENHVEVLNDSLFKTICIVYVEAQRDELNELESKVINKI